MRISLPVTVLLTPILLATYGYPQDVLVKINRLHPATLELRGFELSNEQKINIDAVGLHQKSDRGELILGTTWILNSTNRQVVWSLAPAKFRSGLEVENQKDEIKLPSGNYEVYYSTYPYFTRYDDWDWDHHRWRGIGSYISNFFDRLFDGDYDFDDYDYYDDFADKFQIVIKGNGKALDQSEIETIQDNIKKDATIFLDASTDDLYLTQGFEIKRPMELNIYAIGEERRDGNFDYGWIINTNTREKLWKLDYFTSEHAGGANKNRMVNQTLSLPTGQYAAVFITDDSHSPKEWNSAMTYNPAFWGMTINLKDASDTQYFRKFDYQNLNKDKIIFSLTHMQDDDLASKGFTLKKPMDLRVYAIGEGRDGEMFDFGWIVDANTHEKVWGMDFDHTEHAGGAQKNRLVDQDISLPKGDYIAYYATDGSHSYHNWNDSPPYDPDHWGLTILAANDNFSRSDISDYQEKEDKNVLARIVRVRDDEYTHQNFNLISDSEVRIYAVGEGENGRMYDYGWIEDTNSGRVIWEMSYRKTDHAGGARKNRMSNETISLKKGDYEVFYESDDSHSFNDWNDTPPLDPLNWGITVSMVK